MIKTTECKKCKIVYYDIMGHNCTIKDTIKRVEKKKYRKDYGIVRGSYYADVVEKSKKYWGNLYVKSSKYY